jgi:hypothetical protein
MRIFTIIFVQVVVAFAIAGLTGCSSIGKRVESSMVPVMKLRLGPTSSLDRPELIVSKKDAVVLRYADSNALTSMNLQTGREEVFDYDSPSLAVAVSNGLSAYSDGRRIYATWRPKMKAEVPNIGSPGEKFIYVAASDDGVHFVDTHRVSKGGGAFPAVITGSGLGDVYVLWQDERSGKNYDLYFNVSHDYGRTWKPEETRLDPGSLAAGFSAEPTMVAEGSSVWAVWQESANDAGKFVRRVYVRRSEDRGETWHDPVVVAQNDKSAIHPKVVRIGNRLHIYWYDEEGIKGTISLDNGQSWQTIKPLAEGLVIDDLQLRVDRQGVVHLIFSAKTQDSSSKINTYYTRSLDGSQFSTRVRLNAGQEFESAAGPGAIAVDSAGQVLVAWTDKRYFRPTINGRLSTDGGLTWGSEVLFDDGPDSGVSQLPMVVAKDKGFYLTYIRYQSTTLERGIAKVEVVDADTKGSAPPKPADTNALSARVSEWWDSRQAGNWGKSYDLMDPFMRERTKREVYIAAQGLVKYSGYKINKIESIGERRAMVSMAFTSEVPKMEIYGRTIEVPVKEGNIDQEWIWIDGNWYFLFQDLYGRNFMDY